LLFHDAISKAEIKQH